MAGIAVRHRDGVVVVEAVRVEECVGGGVPTVDELREVAVEIARSRRRPLHFLPVDGAVTRDAWAALPFPARRAVSEHVSTHAARRWIADVDVDGVAGVCVWHTPANLGAALEESLVEGLSALSFHCEAAPHLCRALTTTTGRNTRTRDGATPHVEVIELVLDERRFGSPRPGVRELPSTRVDGVAEVTVFAADALPSAYVQRMRIGVVRFCANVAGRGISDVVDARFGDLDWSAVSAVV